MKFYALSFTPSQSIEVFLGTFVPLVFVARTIF